jgi:uncharacterized protein
MKIEIAYVNPPEQLLNSFTIAEGSSVEEAIIQSSILQLHPEIDLSIHKVGIFGKLCALDKKLREQDRIEIYRPLIADPKEVRKKRAAEGKKMKKGTD